MAAFTIGSRTDYTESQSATQSGLRSSTLTVQSETLTGSTRGSPGSGGPFTVPTTITRTAQPSGITTGSCYLYTLTGIDNVGNTATTSTTVEVAPPPLRGDWNFQSGSGTDLTGNWSTFTLEGTASISSNGLAVSGNGSTGDQPSSSAWAEASSYSGPPIGAKTLVAWLKLDSTSGVGGGGGLALDQYLAGANGNDGQVDALDYAERQAFQWVSGSDNFSRPQDFSPGRRRA